MEKNDVHTQQPVATESGSHSSTARSGDESSATIEAVLDRRLRDKLPALILELRDQIDRRLAAEKKFLLTILGGVGFVIGVVTTVFGLSTLREVRALVAEKATEETRKQFEAPETKRQIRTIMQRALLDSYLTQLAHREAAAWDEEPLEMADIDAQQLLELLRDDTTSLRDFRQCVQVLASVAQRSNGTDDEKGEELGTKITDGLASLLGDRPKAPISSSERDIDRQISILRELRQRRVHGLAVVAACRELISQSSQAQLRREAMLYAGEVVDDGAVSALLTAAENARDPLRTVATVMLAKISPDADVVTAWVKLYTESGVPGANFEDAVEMVAALWQDPTKPTALSLLQFIFDKGVFLSFSYPQVWLHTRVDSAAALMRQSPISEQAPNAPTELIYDADPDDGTPVEGLVQTKLNANDLEGVTRILGRLFSRRADRNTPASLTLYSDSAEAILRLEDGSAVNLKEPVIVALGLGGTRDLPNPPFLVCAQASTNFRRRKIAGIEHGDKIRCSLDTYQDAGSLIPHLDESQNSNPETVGDAPGKPSAVESTSGTPAALPVQTPGRKQR